MASRSWSGLLGIVVAAAVAWPCAAQQSSSGIDLIQRSLGAPTAAAADTPRPAVGVPIPDDARTGVMTPPNGRLVTIDGKALRLSPGCRIHDRANRTVVPGSIRERTRVRYLLDARGDVHRVWLLPAG